MGSSWTLGTHLQQQRQADRHGGAHESGQSRNGPDARSRPQRLAGRATRVMLYSRSSCSSAERNVHALSRQRSLVPIHPEGHQSRVLYYCLQAEDEAMQTRALQALQSLGKGKKGGSNLPVQSIQTAFQQGKGLPRLVHLLDRVVTPRSSRSGQGKAIMAGAIDALAAMTRNNASARQVFHHSCRPESHSQHLSKAALPYNEFC